MHFVRIGLPWLREAGTSLREGNLPPDFLKENNLCRLCQCIDEILHVLFVTTESWSPSSLSIKVPPRKTTMATSKSFSSVAYQTTGIHYQIISRPFQLFLLLEELSNIIFSACLYPDSNVESGKIKPAQCITLCGRAVRAPTILPSHSQEIPYRPAKGVPSERL